MAGADEPEVKDVDTVYVEPAGKDAEDVEIPEATDPDSSLENDGEPAADPDAGKPDQLVNTTPPAGSTEPGGDDGLKEVPGETPRERALRAELTRTRSENRRLRGDEILGDAQPPAPTRKELPPEKRAVLDKYKPEEINALREVIPALAEEMGFVRKDEIAGTTFAEKSQEVLDTFLEKHPEYMPENDPDSTLWNAFKSEYQLYKTPTNPKDFGKLFERVHEKVFGIKPAGAKTTINAQQERRQVASHASASSTPPAPRSRAAVAPQGLRLDMLKGFNDEEKAELTGE